MARGRQGRIEVEWVLNPSLQTVEEVPDYIPWVFDTETTGLEVAGGERSQMRYFGAGPLNNTRLCYIWTADHFTEEVRQFFNNRRLIAHNAKFDILAARLEPKLDVQDTMHMVYHHDTVALKGLDMVARCHGLPKIATPPELKEGKIDMVPLEKVCDYLADDVAATSIIANRLLREDRANCPIHDAALKVLAKAEDRGVRFIPEALEAIRPKVQAKYVEARATLECMGFDGNLGSPKQIGDWLLSRRIKLPETLKSKKARQLDPTKEPRFSTNKLVLEKLAWNGQEEAVWILEARKRLKLQQAFLDSLPDKVFKGMVYPSINMARTKTGRLSYSGVNLQQIPKHDPIGVGLRACFTGPRGFVSVADYSQVEMRVAAALSGDPVLLQIFDSGEDLHTQVASAVLGISPKNLTSEERFGAKAINFGILNGMGPKRLSHNLRSDYDTAARWLNDYRERFSVLANWMDTTWAEAEAYRTVRTLSGRTRIFRRGEEVRSAVSVKVQGTAADLLYGAMVAVDEAGLPVLFSVHDEIVADTRDVNMLVEVMQDAANSLFPEDLGCVSFEADGYFNDTWKEPKDAAA